MILDALTKIMLRELNSLQDEIRQYKHESDLWKKAPGIRNSAGNLILHVTGNLQHYIGAILGGNGYRRNRDFEFNAEKVAVADLIKEIEAAKQAVKTTFSHLTADDLDKLFPETVGGVELQTGLFLLHLSAHLAYHVGQINYHRRMITGENGEKQPLSIAALN